MSFVCLLLAEDFALVEGVTALEIVLPFSGHLHMHCTGTHYQKAVSTVPALLRLSHSNSHLRGDPGSTHADDSLQVRARGFSRNQLHTDNLDPVSGEIDCCRVYLAKYEAAATNVHRSILSETHVGLCRYCTIRAFKSVGVKTGLSRRTSSAIEA